MSLVSALAIYFIIWWLVFFCTLPFGVRTQDETEEVVAGSAPSAPARPMLWRKMALTTVIAALVFAVVAFVLRSGLTLDDIPFLPRMEEIRLSS